MNSNKDSDGRRTGVSRRAVGRSEPIVYAILQAYTLHGMAYKMPEVHVRSDVARAVSVSTVRVFFS